MTASFACLLRLSNELRMAMEDSLSGSSPELIFASRIDDTGSSRVPLAIMKGRLTLAANKARISLWSLFLQGVLKG